MIRLFLILLLVTPALAQEQQAVAPKQPKLLFDYSASGQPAVDGWTKIPTYDRGFFNTDRSRAVKSEVQKIALAHTLKVPLIWNIEHWKIPQEQDKLIEVIQWAREVRPDLRQSIYAMAPSRSYWAPVEVYIIPHNPTYLARFEAWSKGNDALKPLASAMDFTTPSLYTFYRDKDGNIGRNNEFWFVYAESNIAEAKRYNKPVIPFLSPRYWAVAGAPPIEIDLFKKQVEFVLQRADGVILFDWSGNNPKVDMSQMMREIAEEYIPQFPQ